MRTHLVMWLWQGWRPGVYRPRHVAAMASMIRRHSGLHQPRVLCIADEKSMAMPGRAAFGGMDLAKLWPRHPRLPLEVKDQANCWNRLPIFDPARQAELGIRRGDVVLSVDLDGILMGSLVPTVELLAQGATFVAMRGRMSRIHGAFFGFRAGHHADVWADFDPDTSPAWAKAEADKTFPRAQGSDQLYLSAKIPQDQPTLGPDEGFRSWGRHGMVTRRKDPQVYWSFAGPIKPWHESTYQQFLPWCWQTYREASE